MATQLAKLRITEVSGVDSPASHMEGFIVMKRLGGTVRALKSGAVPVKVMHAESGKVLFEGYIADDPVDGQATLMVQLPPQPDEDGAE